jgi:hypothetical protein
MRGGRPSAGGVRRLEKLRQHSGQPGAAPLARSSGFVSARTVKRAASLTPAPPVADFADLVARALEILAEETEAWRARVAQNRSDGSSR